MRNVFAGATVTEAAVVRNMLTDNGIVCQLVEKSTTLYPEVFTEVWVVGDGERDRAMGLIREMYARADKDDLWSCSKCGEGNPSNFEVCWRCTAARDG